jgi:hypothetical protein
VSPGERVVYDGRPAVVTTTPEMGGDDAPSEGHVHLTVFTADRRSLGGTILVRDVPCADLSKGVG